MCYVPFGYDTKTPCGFWNHIARAFKSWNTWVLAIWLDLWFAYLLSYWYTQILPNVGMLQFDIFLKKWGRRAGSSVTSRDCSCRGHRVTHGHPWCLPCLAHLVSICGLLQAWSPAYHSRAKRSRCFPDSPDWEALVPKLSCVMILFPSVLQKLETTAGSTVTSRPSGSSHLQWEGPRVLLQVPSAPWYPRTWTFFALDCIIHFNPT